MIKEKTTNKVIEVCGVILYDPTKDPQDSDGTGKSSPEWDILMANRVCKLLCSLDEDWIDPLLYVFESTLTFYGSNSL